MPMTNAEEEWLIASRRRRKTKTVRLDTTLIAQIPGGLSDILNLALKRYLEEKALESQQSKGLAEEITSVTL